MGTSNFKTKYIGEFTVSNMSINFIFPKEQKSPAVFDLLKYLTEILEIIKKIENIVIDSIFSDKDVRKTFFAKIANALRIYYLAYNSMLIASMLRPENEKSFKPEEVKHIKNFGWILVRDTNQEYLDTYQSIIKLNLLNGCWVCYESSLDALYCVLANEEKRESLELKKYYEIKKIVTIQPENEEKLKKKLRNKHVSINDKWNIIFKLASESKTYNRNISGDKSFLEFFGTCRNCMHNNAVPFRSVDFSTSIGNFSFKENVPIDFVTPDIILKMVNELVDIYITMVSLINHDDEIMDLYISNVDVLDE